MSDQHNSIKAFVDDCESGMDIEFSYHGIEYGILGWKLGGPVIYCKEPPLSETQYQNVDELLDNFKIEGNPLRAIIKDIELE